MHKNFLFVTLDKPNVKIHASWETLTCPYEYNKYINDFKANEKAIM